MKWGKYDARVPQKLCFVTFQPWLSQAGCGKSIKDVG